MFGSWKSSTTKRPQIIEASKLTNWNDDELSVKSMQSRFQPDIHLNRRVALWRGDMTKLKIGAIVNAANTSLLGGGGIDGAIHRAAGRNLLAECRSLRGCPTGQTKITKAYDLPCDHVLHTVGPIYGNPKSPELLASCYTTSLEVAKKNGVRSICFCCISTGIYGYPNEKAAAVALMTVREWLSSEENQRSIDLVVFCAFLEIDFEIYSSFMRQVFPRSESSDMAIEGTEMPPTGPSAPQQASNIVSQSLSSAQQKLGCPTYREDDGITDGDSSVPNTPNGGGGGGVEVERKETDEGETNNNCEGTSQPMADLADPIKQDTDVESTKEILDDAEGTKLLSSQGEPLKRSEAQDEQDSGGVLAALPQTMDVDGDASKIPADAPPLDGSNADEAKSIVKDQEQASQEALMCVAPAPVEVGSIESSCSSGSSSSSTASGVLNEERSEASQVPQVP